MSAPLQNAQISNSQSQSPNHVITDYTSANIASLPPIKYSRTHGMALAASTFTKQEYRALPDSFRRALMHSEQHAIVRSELHKLETRCDVQALVEPKSADELVV